ncbi:MAG: hypothetical protein IIZ22_04690, partial [Clostridia bacterium]|nr:hypothetical protein [Clostridia bacterium]
YCYEMTYGKDKALIVCSFSDENLHFKAPKGFSLDEKYIALYNYPDKPNGDRDELFLRPYEAAVFLYK